MSIVGPDPNSFANNNEARVAHFHLSLTADFQTNQLSGHCDVTVETVTENVTHVSLDTKDLTITGVTIANTGEFADYKIHEPHAVFGSKLDIELPDKQRATIGSRVVFRIAYSTSPDASGVQWLPKEQTAGKEHPYLFTQCQAIHARTLLPCQDTSSNKSTYSADVTVPSPLVALMSAASTTSQENKEANTHTYHFDQKVNMPSYLVALAIGNLVKEDISERCAVWSEPSMVKAGAHEFAEVETFLQAAETICGPYVWGRYDVLLLPPSFPYGGMENPCLTFVTPTLLAGDRSLANVVAHEISHSWMGNLVGCTNWQHFWLNEGWTVFVERKIEQAVNGVKAQHLMAILGSFALKDSIKQMGENHQFTQLVPDLTGVDPDDAFSSVPYEKGFNFLWYLQTLVGEEEFSTFLKAYVKNFSFRTLTSDEFQTFFVSHFSDTKGTEIAAVDWKAWLHTPGQLPVENKFDTTLVQASRGLASAYVAVERTEEGKGICSIGQELGQSIWKWRSQQVVIFLETVLASFRTEQQENKQTAASKYRSICVEIDANHNISATKNSEIRFRWLLLGIACEYTAVFPDAMKMATEQGRMKFVRPLYRELFATEAGKDLAVSTFQQHKQSYNLICAKMVSKDLQLE